MTAAHTTVSSDDTTKPIDLGPAPDAYRILFRQVIMARAMIGFAVAGVVFVATAAIQYRELVSKPSADDVRESVDSAVKPLESAADDLHDRMEKVEGNLGRMQRVLEYQVEQSAWQSQVLDHIATKRKGRPPRKPARLLEMERELIRR